MLSRTRAALASLLLLTACASTESLDQLRVTEPVGDAFQKSLAATYREYAETRAAQYDWQAAQYFADKGLLAASGAEIGPEDPARWNIPSDKMLDLLAARERLVKAVVANRSTQPEMSASATLAYDRWVEQQHYGTSATAIAEQRSVFEAILAKLEEVYAADPTTAPTTTIPEDSKAAVLYFPLDADHLGDSAISALDGVVRYANKNSKTGITINGHADRTGSEDYNMDLSQRRARFVVKVLNKAGITRSRLHYYAFGESDPAVPTADGVPEPKNRRVEISVE